MAASLLQYRGDSDCLVLGIARGGVPAATEVARELELPLDVIVPRRLLAARRDGTATSAVKIAGYLVVDPELEQRLDDEGSGARTGVAESLAELEVRDARCRGSRAPLDVHGRTVLAIDNGIHTGATMLVVLRALRSAGVSRIVAGAPAAAPLALSLVNVAADEVVTLAGSEPFGHVGMWYKRLDVPSFDDIALLMTEASDRR